MTVRLVLVSIVACVGLTLPSAERLERWRRSGLVGRTSKVVVDADSVARRAERFVVVADARDVVSPRVDVAAAESDDQALQAAWLDAIDLELAPPSATDMDPATQTIAPIEPVVEAEDPAFQAAWLAAIESEAARPSDTEMDLASAEEPAPPSVVQVEDPAFAATLAAAIEYEAAPPSDTALDSEPAEELATVAVEAPAAVKTSELSEPLKDEKPADVVAVVPPAPPAHVDAEFSAIVEEMAAAFAKDNETVAARAHSAPEAPQPATAPAQPSAPAVAFEPMAVEEHPSDVAHVLNGEAEGLRSAAPMLATTSTPRETRLSHAVKLTREAVNAWAALLHGPALVTIER